jgi:hypothetical protein
MNGLILTTIVIGGIIPRKLTDELIEWLYDDLKGMNDDLKQGDIKKFIDRTFSCSGFTEWGICDNTEGFCRWNKLPFITKTKARIGTSVNIRYWLPGMVDEMEEVTNPDFYTIINTDDIKPYIDFLLRLAKEKDPKTVLALYINDPVLKDTVALCYENPEKIYSIIDEKIKELLPSEIPELPDFIIK